MSIEEMISYNLPFTYPDFGDHFAVFVLDWCCERNDIVLVRNSNLLISLPKKTRDQLTVLGMLGFMRRISLTTASRYGSSSI
jgi:hypothetical protein